MLTSRGHVVACFDLKYFPPTMSRSTKATRGSVRHIGEHPAWLLDRLLYARLRRTEEGALMLIVEAEDTVGSHLALATLYALVYSGCVLALASAAFESRDFK